MNLGKVLRTENVVDIEDMSTVVMGNEPIVADVVETVQVEATHQMKVSV